MKVKTIHLPSDTFRLTTTGVIEAFYETDTGYLPDYEADNFTAELEKCSTWGWHETNYKLGQRAILVSHTNVSPNAIRSGSDTPEFSLVFDLDGVPGNLNHNIKQIHGWRGTTNNMSVYAYGEREIIKIRKLKNGTIAVTVGADISPNKK